MTGYSGPLEIALFYLVIAAILAVPIAFLSFMLVSRRRAERAHRREEAASRSDGGAAPRR